MTARADKVVMIEPADRRHMNIPVLRDLRANGIDVAFFASPDAPGAAEAIAGARVLISTSCPETLMERAPGLSAIINPYTGSEHIDRAAATRRGILIGYGQVPENYVGMAEATFFLLLACFYDLHESEQVLRAQLPRPAISARLIAGKTIGIIGHGKISQALVDRFAGWGADLLISAPRLHASLPDYARHVELDELLPRSDAIVLLCSLNAATRNLLSRERLALVKPGAAIVNTARGGIVDEEALAGMLTEGRLRRVALDAFEVEPLPGDSALRAAPNAILTSHMIGHNIEAEEAMARNAVEAVRRVLAGKPPEYIFNPEVLARWRVERAIMA